MAITLEVPFVTQLGIGSHVPAARRGTTQPHNDPTGCWYASACMVGYYFEQGPRFGVPALYKEILGGGQLGHFATGSTQAKRVAPFHHAQLAMYERLAPVPKCSRHHNYTLDELEELLRTRGPIFMYWQKSHGGYTYGHASVIIGVSRNGIIYHDPENRPNDKMPLAMFNHRRQVWKYALMQRKAQGSVAARRRLFENMAA